MATLKGDGKIFIMIFFAAIIAVTFLSSISDTVFTTTNTISFFNITVTAPAVNATLDLTGRDLLGTGFVTNVTNPDGTLQNAGVFLQQGTVSGGVRTVQLTVNDTGVDFASQPVNVTYSANPDGYINNSAGRSVTLLITIFGALAILVTVIVFLLMKNGGSLHELMKI